MDLICRAHQVKFFLSFVVALLEHPFTQVVEDGYEFFAKRQLVTLFSAPNYCGEFDNAGGMMSVDESLMCSFQVCTPRSFPVHLDRHLSFSLDSQTKWEESEISIRWSEQWPTTDTSPSSQCSSCSCSCSTEDCSQKITTQSLSLSLFLLEWIVYINRSSNDLSLRLPHTHTRTILVEKPTKHFCYIPLIMELLPASVCSFLVPFVERTITINATDSSRWSLHVRFFYAYLSCSCFLI